MQPDNRMRMGNTKAQGAHPPPRPIPSPPDPQFASPKFPQVSPTAVEVTSTPWTNKVILEASVVTQSPAPP